MSIARHMSLHGGWLLVVAAMGCSAGASSKRQLDEMRREIHAVQSNNDRLNERVTALELASQSPDKKQADPHERPELEVVRLAPDMPTDDVEEATEDAGPPTVIRAEGKRVPSVQRGRAPSKDAKTAEAARRYDKGLDLIDRKQYDAALDVLAGFLVRYPGHPNAENAMYWRGECYYAKGNYMKASEQFEGLIMRFPDGNKHPDALLKLGLSQQRMGERDKAASTFAQLRKNHPNSDAASKIPRE